jgi:hypothetical protein
MRRSVVAWQTLTLTNRSLPSMSRVHLGRPLLYVHQRIVARCTNLGVYHVGSGFPKGPCGMS